MNKKNKITLIIVTVLLIIGMSGLVYKRFDLTAEKRYTLSDSTIKVLESVNKPMTVEVYLDGDFPASFKQLQNETKFMSLRYRFSPQTVKVLVWGGIRGGVSIALALSIPQNEYNKIIISITYCVVVFSIVVQGLTIGKVANPKKIATEEKILEEIH